MMGDKDGRFAGGRGARHHYPVTKLQEGRQEEIMMGDKDGRFAGGRGARHHYPDPKLQEKRQ